MGHLNIIAAPSTPDITVLQVQALEGEGDGVPASRRQLPGLQHVKHCVFHCGDTKSWSPVHSHADRSLGSLESGYKTLKCYGWVNKKYRRPRYSLK